DVPKRWQPFSVGTFCPTGLHSPTKCSRPSRFCAVGIRLAVTPRGELRLHSFFFTSSLLTAAVARKNSASSLPTIASILPQRIVILTIIRLHGGCIDATKSIYLDRVARRHRHYCHPDLPVGSGGSEGPRCRRANAMSEQPEADRAGLSQLSRRL